MPNDDNINLAASNSSKQTLTDKAVGFVADRLVSIQSVPKEQRLATLTNEQKHQIEEVQNNAIRNHAGQIDELISALGMLNIGHHFGWRVLHLIHSKKTVRKYEEILGIKIREFFPETGPSSARSVGLAIASTYPNFWKVVSGDIKIPDRRKVE